MIPGHITLLLPLPNHCCKSASLKCVAQGKEIELNMKIYLLSSYGLYYTCEVHNNQESNIKIISINPVNPDSKDSCTVHFFPNIISLTIAYN